MINIHATKYYINIYIIWFDLSRYDSTIDSKKKYTNIFSCINLSILGFINSILSFKLFIPLSRLSYCAYLVHPIIMMGYFAALKILINFSHMTMVSIERVYFYNANLFKIFSVHLLHSYAFNLFFLICYKTFRTYFYKK